MEPRETPANPERPERREPESLAAGQVPLGPVLTVEIAAGFAEARAGVQLTGTGVGGHDQQPVPREAAGPALVQQRPGHPAAIAPTPCIRTRGHAVQPAPPGPG